jgi:hypothetical protein
LIAGEITIKGLLFTVKNTEEGNIMMKMDLHMRVTLYKINIMDLGMQSMRINPDTQDHLLIMNLLVKDT